MILLDSSAWLEIFVGGALADDCERYLKQNSGKVIVSVINIYEVYRRIARQSEDLALQAVALMKQQSVQMVDEQISLDAGDLSIKYGLAMADSLLLATAYKYKALLLTKDVDFNRVPGCKILK